MFLLNSGKRLDSILRHTFSIDHKQAIMKPFLDQDFLLQSEIAKRLYHDYAADMPIIDYHCHLSPKDIAENRTFRNLTEIWLEGDHYKWRAMRTNGVDEKYITGEAEDYPKFEKWAETVPYTMRNPLYHWTHMELKNPFGIQKLLNSESSREIYDQCTEMLQDSTYTTQGILKQMKVELVCTTDDPTDTLEFHQQARDAQTDVRILPTFRPDKVLAIEDPITFNAYIDLLGERTGKDIAHFTDLIDALEDRIQFFHEMGGRLSDHGLETVYASAFNEEKVGYLFQKLRMGQPLEEEESLKYKSAILKALGKMYHAKGWTMQFHLGAMRGNNKRMKRLLGADSGFDSIGDYNIAAPLSRFLDSLDEHNTLAKTILYNLNPKDNEMMATMIGNFNDGSVPGKMQWGSAWWFLDQKDGMEKQMNTLSNMGLLSRFVGMLTDSRSFLSFPRHEYFRRILCNLIGQDIENGELPHDEKWLGKMIQNICYYNAKSYFGFETQPLERVF